MNTAQTNDTCCDGLASASELILIPATRFWERLSGLYRVADLADNTGLWITPCRAIHTLGMAYHIDVLYLDDQRTIIKRIDAMRPHRFSVCLRARSVLELPAGFCRAHPDYARLVQQAFQSLQV